MKNLFKIPLLIATLSVSLTGFNQAPETPSPLNSYIKPSDSRGYICWNEFEGADQYLIRIYTADEDGVLSVIREVFTTKNYHLLGLEYLTDISKFYSISAYNRGVLVEEGDRTPFAQEYLIDEECKKKCNGETYAYQISYLTYENAPAYVNDRLVVNPTNNFVDLASGIGTPFYQAVSMAQHDIMIATGHPYAEINGYTINGPNWVYKHVPIISSCTYIGGVAVGAPYTDANGNPVCDGYLIEKKMDQFSYMASNSTSSDPGINICDPTVPITWGGGMMAYYNAYQNPIDPAYIPANTLPFTAITPTSLECNGTGGYSGPGGGSGFTPVEDWPNDFVNCIFEAVIEVSNEEVPANFDPCFKELVSPGSGVTGLLFEPLDQAVSNVFVTNNDGRYTVEGELFVGLYNMHIFTDAGGVLSTVGEVTEEDLIPEPAPTSTAVDLSIAPNPILENMLIYSIASELETSVRITITNLNGEITFDSEESLSIGSDLRMEMSVDPETYTYGQIVITLTFPDGSTIQEIGLIE